MLSYIEVFLTHCYFCLSFNQFCIIVYPFVQFSHCMSFGYNICTCDHCYMFLFFLYFESLFHAHLLSEYQYSKSRIFFLLKN